MNKSIETGNLIGKTIITKDKKRYKIIGYIMHGDFIVESNNSQVLISPEDIVDIIEPREYINDLEYLYLGYADGEW